MKKLVSLILLAILIVPSVCLATEGFNMAKGGQYEWQLKDDVLVINTAFPMMLEKEGIASDAQKVSKMCNPVGQSVYGQLMKIGEVSMVIISNRQLAVRKYGFPKKWDNIIPQVLSAMDKISSEAK